MASWLTTRNSNLAAFNAFSINYSTLTGSTSNNVITAGRVNYSTITGSSVAATSVAATSVAATSVAATSVTTNSLALASTLTGSSIILSGNVGIGTNAPAYTLDLGSNTIGCGAVNTASVTTKGTGNLTVGTQSTGLLVLNSQGGALALQSAGSTLFSITASSTYSLLTATADMTLQTGGTNSNLYINSKGTGFISLGTNSNTRVLINSSGYVGIGTDNPSQKLHVFGNGARMMVESISASENAVVQLKTNNNMNYIYTEQTGALIFKTGNASHPIVLQPGGGNVGIGTATATKTLTVSNSDDGGQILFNTTLGASCSVGIDASNAFLIYPTVGNGVFLRNGVWNVNSDIRLKRNVVTIPSALSSIQQLRPVTFNYTSDTSDAKLHVGFIAQEVDAIFPKENIYIATVNECQQCVDADGNSFSPLSLSTTQLIPYIIRSIQELAEENTVCKQQLVTQQTQITAQQTEINDLKTQLSQVLQRLAAAGIA